MRKPSAVPLKGGAAGAYHLRARLSAPEGPAWVFGVVILDAAGFRRWHELNDLAGEQNGAICSKRR